jgi:hypothetical protein
MFGVGDHVTLFGSRRCNPQEEVIQGRIEFIPPMLFPSNSSLKTCVRFLPGFGIGDAQHQKQKETR